MALNAVLIDSHWLTLLDLASAKPITQPTKRNMKAYNAAVFWWRNVHLLMSLQS